VEPLCAVYRAAALDALGRHVAAGRLDLHGLVGDLRALRAEGAGGTGGDAAVRVVPVDDCARFGDPRHLFTNVNRVDDLERVRALAAGST
jgi:molybdopterin-guanine dinucleotide biosynthesis protein A